VVAFFVRFPEIAAASFATAGQVIRKVFTLDFIANAAKSVFEFIVKLFKSTIDVLFQLVKAIGTSIWEPLRFGFEWIGARIKFAWQTVVNALITALNFITTPIEAMINGIIAGLNKVVEAGKKIGLFQKAGTIETISLKIDAKTIDEIKEPIPIDTKKMVGEWDKLLGMVPTILKDTFTNAIDLLGDVFGPLAPLFKDLGDTIKGVVNKPLEPQYQDAADKAAPMADEKPATSIPTGGSSGGGFSFDLGWIGDLLGGFADGLSGIMGVVGPLIGSLSSVMMVMQPLQTILQGMMSVLSPIIDNLMKPLIGILTILGQTLGKMLIPLFKMLGPIIEMVAKVFVWLYNKVIVPIGNFMIKIFTAIANFILSIVNAIIWAVNLFLPKSREIAYVQKLNPNDMMLDTIDTGDIATAGESATTSGGGGSAAAQYTEAPDIYITVNVYNGVGVMTDRTMTIEDLSILISDTTESLLAKGTV
jgi:hypothetical protein